MNALVELIKRIGIFMIAAQAVIHFTPGQKYEKYIKLIVGMMILLQFVMPLHSIISGEEIDLRAQLTDMERMLETEGMADGAAGSLSVAEAVMNSLENEIKSRLNNEISGEDYAISNVQVSMKVSDGGAPAGMNSGWKASDRQSGTGTRQYELEKVRVAVYRRSGFADSQTPGNAGSPIEKVQIEKIEVGGAADNGISTPGNISASDNASASDSVRGGGSPCMEGTEETAEQLRERFCDILGMDEEKMEVSIYGTNEKTDR